MGHADRHPERDAAVFTRYEGRQRFSTGLTYGRLHTAARATAAWLLANCQPGDRVLLLYPSGLEFIRSFWACLYAGMIPVPAPAPDGGKHHLMRVTGIALDVEPSVVLTDGQSLVAVANWLRQDGLDDLRCVATDTAELADPEQWRRPSTLGPDTLALLWYSTGPAREPRGVMLSHKNILHNLRLIESTYDLTAETRFCGWLPLFHDIGLIAQLLGPHYLGATAVLMTYTDFLERPHRWLDLIGEENIRFSAAPAFAYDLCARLLTDEQLRGLDLSGWLHAFRSGSEVVDNALLDRFSKRFASSGFRPESFRVGYGNAECTLLVAGSPVDRPPVATEMAVQALGNGHVEHAAPGADSRLLVSGGTVRDLDVRIVDPATFAPRPPGQLGEVWVRGDSVAQGYWRRTRQTRETFQATTAAGETGFLRTGDLGAFADGELYILGRIAEVLVVHGRHVYPDEVERVLRAMDPAFSRLTGSLFALPGPALDIVVMHEVRGKLTCERLAALADGVRDALGTRFGVRVAHVVFVRPGKIRRTANGRVLHTLMRELYLADALDPVFAGPEGPCVDRNGSGASVGARK